MKLKMDSINISLHMISLIKQTNVQLKHAVAASSAQNCLQRLDIIGNNNILINSYLVSRWLFCLSISDRLIISLKLLINTWLMREYSGLWKITTNTSGRLWRLHISNFYYKLFLKISGQMFLRISFIFLKKNEVNLRIKDPCSQNIQ